MNLNKSPASLSHFFYPKNIVVVGVSPDPANLGKNIVQNCLTFGYPGEVLSVGMNPGVVFGQRIYTSLDQVDRPVELAVILTPARTIPGILEQCGRKGIKWAVIESGGFSELGKHGTELEEACCQVARKYGIRFIGPNGIGLTNLENGLALPFWPLREDIKPGHVSVLAQSGGVGLSYLSFLAEENIGINKFVSMGNKLNVDENDLIGYLIQDEGTKVILMYLEGFTDGRRFVEIASASHKPVIIQKSNRFKASAQIAHSHTTALFTNDALVGNALEQAGCIRADTLNEAVDYIKAMTMPPLRGNRIAVVSRSGGHAVITADACGYYGFHLPDFPPDLLKKVENRLRAHVIRLQNPLDLGDLFDLDFYEYIVEELLKREDLDGLLLGHGYRRGFEQKASRELIGKVADLSRRYEKPVALFVIAEAMEIAYLKKNYSIPIFTAPENAMRAFDLSRKWHSSRELSSRPPRGRVRKTGSKTVESILDKGKGRGALLLSEGLDLLKAAGFPTPGFRLARTPDEAVNAWKALKGPVAVKLNQPHLSHKTDSGGVVLGISDENGMREAFARMEAAAGRVDIEVLVQRMADNGLEIILGGKRDNVFGPVIVFGLGGILVEAVRDVVWRVAPFDAEEAGLMIRRIRGRRLFKGFRGEPPRDMEAVQGLLEKLSRLMADFPVIQEMDVNPVLVHAEGKGVTAVDARVILES